jgi:ribosomal protein S18 acetylase RimI-like enzyme
MIEIVDVTTDAQIETVRTMFVEYGESLGFSLCFQGFDEELESLPGAYARPDGRLYLGMVDGVDAGCIGLRPIRLPSFTTFGGSAGTTHRACEMKRLWVRSDFRGKGLARLFAEKLIADAREIGYNKMVLDTVKTMTAARALYESLGFVECAPYYLNPLDEVVYMEKTL